MLNSRIVWIAQALLIVAAAAWAQTPRGANNSPTTQQAAEAETSETVEKADVAETPADAETADAPKTEAAAEDAGTEAATTEPPAAAAKDETAANASPAEPAKPAAAPATDVAKAEAAPAASDTAAKPKGEIRFQFDGVPYDKVIRRFAQMAGKPLIGDVSVEGELTFFDAQPYTYEEAADTLNLLLAMKGYALREEGRFLRLRPLAEISSTTKILRGLGDADQKDIRPHEIVTVVLPMKFLDPNTAAKTVIRMVSSFGSIAPLGQGRALVITDKLSNIRRIQGLLASLDIEAIVDRQLKTYFLKNANASDVAGILNNLFGQQAARRWQYNPQRNRLEPQGADPADVVQVSHDERTNMVVLVGAGDKLAMAEQMITTLDQAEGTAAGDMKIFDLVNARADDVARTVQQLVQRRGRGKGRDQEARVVADSASNRLVVSAGIEDMRQITKLIKELDTESKDRESMRIFTLKVADAQELTGTVHRAIVRRDSRGRTQRPLTTIADTRTNTLIVSGPPTDIEAASQLIAQLDKKDPAEATLEVHVVQLEAGNVWQISSALNRILDERMKNRDRSAPRPRVEIESDTNSLIVAATPEDWTMVKGVLDEVQSRATVKTPVTRMVRLQHAEAEELARTLQQAVRSRSWGRRGPGSVPIYIVASKANNSLLITAAETEQAEVAQMITSLDVPASEKSEPFTMIRLATADAEELADKIRSLMPNDTRGRDADVYIEADRLTNSVLLRATDAKREQIEEIIAKLDDATQADARETRIVSLENISAAALQAMLQDLYPGSGGRRRGNNEDPERVIITAAPHDKAIIVEAPKKRIEEIAQLAKTLDAEGEVGQLQVRTYQLETGSAADVAQSLSRLFVEQRGRRQPESGRPQPRFEADRASNQLMIAATLEDFQRIEQLITKLQQTSKLSSQTKTFKLKFAKAEEIAEMLRSMLLEDRGMGRRRWWDADAGKTAMRIAAMESANAVVVQGPPERLTLAEELIAGFDTEESAEKFRREVRTYQLKSGNAADVAKSLASLFSEQRGRRGGSDEPQPRFEADRTTNQVMVSATGEQFKEIGKIIAELQAKSELAYQTKTYRLQYARAEEIAEMLESVLLSDGGTSRRRWWEADAGKSALRVSTVASANAVVVQGTPEKLAMADELVQTFDTEKTADLSTIRVVRLKNAQAETLAKSVTQSLAERGRGRGTAAQEVTVTPETNSNSVLVRGPVAKVAEVVEMIQGLDADSVSEDVQVRVYTLKNSNAKELANNLKQMFNDLLRQQQRSRSRREATPFSVASDERTNSLVVSTAPAYFALVEQMLQQLDGKEKAPRDVELVFLENADASDVASQLQDMFRDRGWSERPVVQADYSANTVTLIGNDADLKLMMRVVGKLDEAAARQSVAVRVVPLEGVRAAKMADMLQRLYGQMTQRKVIVTERIPEAQQAPATPLKAVDPAGTQEAATTQATTQSAVEDDEPEQQTAPTAKLPESEPTPPATTAQTPPAGETKVFGPQPSAQRIVIAVDAKSNSLLLSGPRRDLDELDMLITELSWGTTAADAELRVFDIKNADPATVATTLDQLFNPQTPRQQGRRLVMPEPNITVVAEPRTRRLIVRAKPLDFEVIESVIKQLDTVATVISEIRVFTLKNTKASTVAQNLQQLFAGDAATSTQGRRSPQWQRQQQVRQMIELRGGDGKTRVDAGATVSITANEESNSVVVAAPADAMTLIAGLVQELDQSAAETGTSVYILPLEAGDATRVAEMVRDLYNQQQQAARRNRQTLDPLAVSADQRANAIVVATSKTMYEQVSRWVQQVEQMKPARGTLRVITVEHADPKEVKKAIDQLYNVDSGSSNRRRGRGSSSGGGPVETTVLEKQRAVMVSADDDEYAAIKQVVDALEAAALENKRQNKIFNIENASNIRVAQALQQMYRSRGRGSAEEEITISAMSNSNAVVVAAPKSKMEEIAHLIQQLDQPDIAPKLEYRIYPLENAQPTKILGSLRQMLNEIRRVQPDATINVQADERTRSIIVTAQQADFDQIEKLIKVLDQAPAYETAEVLIIPLAKADAQQLAAVLMEMLRPTQGNQVTPEARALQEQVRLLKVRSTMKEDIPELDLTQPIKITSDPSRSGSNSLIVSSTPDNLKALRAIVEVMDTVPVAAGVNVKLIHLKNADAMSVMQILNDVFSQGRELAGQRGTATAGRAEPESEVGRALTRELNVSADMRTNSLIIAGEEQVIALASVLVTDLDRDQGRLTTDVKLFRLKHADANRLAPILRAVFSEDSRGNAVAGAEGLRTQVTRLRTHLATDGVEMTEFPKGRPALTIQADPTTNILVVAARSDVMPLIGDVVQSMDIPGAGSLNTVRIFPLVNADAARIAQVVESLYRGPNAQLVRDEDKPTVTTDTRTNSLIISASEQTFSMITTLLGKLDGKTPIDLRDIRLLPLDNADAQTVAQTLQQMMDARVQRQQSLGVKDAEALRVILVGDPRSNSVIVGGSAESFQIVKDIAMQLDKAAPALSGQIQIIPLEEGNAGSIATTLQNLFDRRYQAARTEDLRRQRPIILPDVRTNSLLVAANHDDSKALAGLLKKLDVKLTDPAVRLTVIPLEHNDAGVVGPTIERIFAARLQSMTPAGQQPDPQSRVDVAYDALSNAIIVSASKENLSLIDGLLKKIDIEPPVDSGVVEIIQLERADANRVAALLQGLLSNGLYKPGMAVAGSDQLRAAREKVSLAADMRTNVLIVSASKENLAIIKQIIAQLDNDAAPMMGDLRIVQLANADATRLGPVIQQFFNAKRQAELQVNSDLRIVPLVVVADNRTNTLLLAGGKEYFDAAETMIARLDGDAAKPASMFRVFELSQATATVLQGTLQRLFDQRVTRGETREPVTIIADSRTNSLIVGASDVDMALAASLVQQLDIKPKDGEPVVEVFPLKKGDAATVAETLRSLYRSQAENAAGELSVTTDERINAVLVQAGQADLNRVREIIRQLDREKVTRVTEIQVFTLENAEATELAQILTDVLTNKPPAMTQVSPNRQTLLQFIRQTPDGKQLITNALQEGVLITPDRRTNSLVVSAPLENMPLLKNLIEALDSTSPRSAEIRVFTLNNADATRMAAVLEQLFRMQQSGQPGQAVQYELQQKTANSDPQNDGQVTRATTGQADQAALNITVDMRTNSLIVGGTKQQIDMAAAVIRDLDASPAQDRVTRVYRPKNSQATAIQTALRSFLDQERQRLQQVLGEDRMGAAQQLLESEVAVVAEENTNTLLISASPRYFLTLARIIDELDQPAPQVLIQALLAEVRLDNQTDFGLDWAWNGSRGNTVIDVQGEIGVQASVGADPLGFNVSVTGSDLTFFLRALQQTGRLEVLSRPQVLAVDNTQASINVGERVPLITSSRVTDQGDTINTITYENIGLTLDVLPRIGSDGTIQMEVEPTISSVGTQSTPISEFASAVYLNNRSAETTVTCYDGQTIIIGGLITTTDQDMEDKIPILGDVPGMGVLFRRIEKIKIRDELMIFLTPRVLRSASQAHDMTLDEFRRNDTLRSLKTNHAYKEGALDQIREPDLRRELRKGSNRLPDSPDAVRRENIRQTIMELELLPERWQPYGGPPIDKAPGQRIPDTEAVNPPVEPGEPGQESN